MKKYILFLAIVALLLYSCSPAKRMAATVPISLETLLADSALTNAHTGVYVYNPATQKALYSYQSDKYFVPASNAKLFSCYAGMKYLGDSLVGLRYTMIDDTSIMLQPSGDPTFFHSDYKTNPVFNFLNNSKKRLSIDVSNWQESALGSGWAWNDYDELYMTERSPMPAYENAMMVEVRKYGPSKEDTIKDDYTLMPYSVSFYTHPNIKIAYRLQLDSTASSINLKRDFSTNSFSITASYKYHFYRNRMPFVTNGIKTTEQVLSNNFQIHLDTNLKSEIVNRKWQIIHSQPTDSLLKPMMHRSDNFFAEQTLLMVSNEKLGYMNDRAIIDTILKTDLKDLPQKPVWVDGSGLSRYNLFTPQCFVKVLEKMKDEFGMERMKNILPTGGEGTLSSLYKPIANQIFAKTGTLSGQVALSGYLFTKNNTLLIFSILVNNHNNTASNVRKAVEKFVMDVWEKE